MGTVNFGTWNVRTLNNIKYCRNKEDKLIKVMKEQNLHYLGITETKKKEYGKKVLCDGYVLYWSGVATEARASEGVALIVAPEKVENINEETIRYVNERLLVIEAKWDDEQYTLIIAYAPNDDMKKEIKDAFYVSLQDAIDKRRGKIIIMGDMNARVGNNNRNFENNMGTYGEMGINENRTRLLNFCKRNKLVLTNTMFDNDDMHKYTREMPSRNEKSILDYFMVFRENFEIVEDVKAMPECSAEICSDHHLVQLKLKKNT